MINQPIQQTGEGRHLCQLFPGNACQLLDTMPDGCVDLVLTDPPYGATAAHWDDRIYYERNIGGTPPKSPKPCCNT